jgi:CheY-like chemotaxis protein
MERRTRTSTRPIVLIVHSDEGMRAMYGLALTAMGFDVSAAHDGPEAFRRAWELRPDIIAASLPIPQSGGSLHQALQQNPQTANIPFVVIPKACLPDELAGGIRHVLDRLAHVDATLKPER